MRWRFESQDASGAHEARKDLLAYLGARASPDSDVEAALLIFGELVGNVVRHAPGPIAIDLEWHDGSAILRVRDSGPGFDWSGARQAEPLAEGGRGLFIIETVAREVRIERRERGTEATVWLPVHLRQAAS
jgi:anti-sigma regulatory factor (Ser/Thr protein kinase)